MQIPWLRTVRVTQGNLRSQMWRMWSFYGETGQLRLVRNINFSSNSVILFQVNCIRAHVHAFNQVHHLTAHIDDITAEMSSPLDHLVEVALQANQRSGLAKQHLMDQFESKASFLSDQLEAVCEMFSEVTDQVTVRDPTIEKVNAGLAFLKKLSPHAIGAARSLACEFEASG